MYVNFTFLFHLIKIRLFSVHLSTIAVAQIIPKYSYFLSGIGKEAVFSFARMGARVIMACRNLKKAQPIAGDITSSILIKTIK